MTHILFVTGDHGRLGGTERACASVTRELSRNNGVEISIQSHYGNNQSYFPSGRNVRLSTVFPGRSPGSLWRMLLLFLLVPWRILRSRADTVVAVESLGFLFILPLRFIPFRRPRLICWEHFNAGINLGIRRRDLARWLAAHFADDIVTLTQEDMNLWEAKYPGSSRRLRAIPNISPYWPPEIAGVQNQDCERRVLAVGRLVPEKGFDLLIEAWAKLPDATRADWQLRIVGDGSQLTTLQAQSITLGIEHTVEFAGAVQDVTWEYRHASLFVLSSRFEGFGLVLIEALSHGLPCLAFDCPTGPREIISDGVNGRLVKCGDVDALAAALHELLINPLELERLCSRSHHGLDRFSPETVTAQWQDLLHIKGF